MSKQKILHIVFQEADVAVLQKAVELDKSLQGDVWQIKDELAVGPIKNIYEIEGYMQRRDWWKEVLLDSPYINALDVADDKLTVHQLEKKLDEEKTDIWLWVAQNAHDVCGYYWLISQLQQYQDTVFILHLHNLPFINEKGGLFYPQVLHDIQPKEFLKAKKLARPVTTSEFEMDNEEWKKLCDENSIIRILEGGKKIISQNDDYYDKAILNLLNTEPQKLGRLLHFFYTKTKMQTGDVFLVWRIKKLIEENKIMMQGDWSKGWKDIMLSLPNYEQASLYLSDETV